MISRIKYLHLSLILILFLAACAATPAYALMGSKSNEKAGAVLFRDKGCAYCHGAGGSGGRKGPDLSGLRKDKIWTPAKIKNQILNGGEKMPPFADSVTEQEISQLVDYLRAKHRPVPPPAAAVAAPSGN